jgi:zinc transporter 1/2/3
MRCRKANNGRFAKFFGSGVIIATAFIHLLAPAFDELGSECLSGTWTEYDWAPAFAMASVYAIFFAEVAAYRIGTAKLAALGVNYSSHHDDHTDAHAHDHRHAAPLNVDTTGPEDPLHVHPSRVEPDSPRLGHSHEKPKDLESQPDDRSISSMPTSAEAAAQLVAVGVLEFGVILHSVIIGLTLAVTGNDEFTTLFIVIIFHQMFEGLGLGSRLASLPLPEHLSWTRWVAAAVYAVCTPIGIAAGLGARQSYNGNGQTAMIVSGILDAVSAGILLYTGLVELLAHEVLLNPRMMKSSTGRLAYIFTCMLLGSALMALLGRWA